MDYHIFKKRFFKKIFVFIYLAALGLSGGMQTLSYGMWDLVPDQGLKPGPLH